jgi:DNA-binding MarR family transcriptional regulator
VARSCGITPRQYLLLLVLESSGRRKPLTIGELSESLGLAPSTMTELIDRAEEAGLLRRAHAQHDRRVFHVCATNEGRKRLVNAFRQLEDERRAVAEVALRLVEVAKNPSLGDVRRV